MNTYEPKSGRMLTEDCTTVNIADLIGGTIVGKVCDINEYTPSSGRMIKEDGTVVNIAEGLEKLVGNMPMSNTKTGVSPLIIKDAIEAPFITFKAIGLTYQDGTPTPSSPISIQSLGELKEDGTYIVFIKSIGTNGKKVEAEIPTSIPFYDGDYIELYSDGTGIEYRINGTYSLNDTSDFIQCGTTDDPWYQKTISGLNLPKATFDTQKWIDEKQYSTHGKVGNSANKSGDFVLFQLNGDVNLRISKDIYDLVSNGEKVDLIYELAEPITTELTSEQIKVIKSLMTFETSTTIYNPYDANMEVQYFNTSDNSRIIGGLSSLVNGLLS